MIIRKFTELEAWKKARKLRTDIASLVKVFPSTEKYRLIDQIIRSSRSVTANIAEGYGRYHHQENIQFCRIARGSLSETFDHLILANDEGFVSESHLKESESQIDECTRVLNGYINYLKRAKANPDN